MNMTHEPRVVRRSRTDCFLERSDAESRVQNQESASDRFPARELDHTRMHTRRSEVTALFSRLFFSMRGAPCDFHPTSKQTP